MLTDGNGVINYGFGGFSATHDSYEQGLPRGARASFGAKPADGANAAAAETQRARIVVLIMIPPSKNVSCLVN